MGVFSVIKRASVSLGRLLRVIVRIFHVIEVENPEIDREIPPQKEDAPPRAKKAKKDFEG